MLFDLDEAHRSQYDIFAANMRSALPNAAFIGFTGTPLMAGEELTKEVFGEYVSVYNFKESVDDENTVPLYYENRIPEDLEKKFKKDDDPLRIVFLCAMWITGFDVPSCSTIYLDKPMKNHTLMQTIARANRVFRDKQNGLIVDYVGVFRNLQKALAIYGAAQDGAGDTPIHDKSELVRHRLPCGAGLLPEQAFWPSAPFLCCVVFRPLQVAPSPPPWAIRVLRSGVPEKSPRCAG